METIFKNTENSKANEFNKFIYQFTGKRNLKTPNNNNIGLVNFTTHRKTLNLHTTTINLKYLLQLGMMNLICLMVLIQFLTFKITLSSKNTKLSRKILLLSLETMRRAKKLEVQLESAQKDVDKDNDGEDVPKLESNEVLLVLLVVTVISKHLKYCLLLYLIHNLVS